MSNSSSKGTALVTGASRGIGAVYADRLAKRGYDLILVARSEARIKELSARLMTETGRLVTTLAANLNNKVDLVKVETTLRNEPTITMLVNNAGTSSITPLLNSDINDGDEWNRFEAARRAISQQFGNSVPAPRYGIGVRRSA